MLDAFVFIDGSTFELRRRLYDAVTVNTSEVELVRNAGNSTENFSYVMNKYLDPDMELLDQISKLGLKSITDVDITSADLTFLYATKPVADTAAPADDKPVFVGLKSFRDTETLVDGLIQFSIAKLLADTTTMLDSMSFGDQLTYDSTKLLSDILTETDRPYLWFAPAVQTETISLADANRSRFTKANTDSADLAETSTKLFGKNTGNILSLADILNITRLRDYADAFTTTDLNRFALTKLFADTVEADDPLIRLSDGNISLLIKQRQDTEPVDDYFARAVKFYRYPHHQDGGLGNFVPVTEDDSKFVSLRARAGALTTYPIVRTNIIAWSEQFNADQSQGYWTSIGTRIISNQTAAPQNVVSSNSTTYDADQLQELFYNKPNNTSYARSWYQLAPGRWVASSDGDLLVQDTSTGTHQLSSPNIPELIGTTNFGFAIHLKYAGHRYVRLWVTSFVNVDVDMVNNVVVATSAAKASMQPVGGGWFLVEVENRIVNFGIAPEMQILNEIFYNSVNSPYGLSQYKLVPDNIISSARIVLLDSSLNTTFTGNGTDGVYIWGAQLEVGDQPEQEISSLKYIRTAGGSATRIGFSVTPTDNDRVFVGRIQRRGNNVGNDPYEIISLLLQYKVPLLSNLATPADYFARSVRYFRSGVIEPGLRDVSSIGLPGQRRYSGDSQENVAFYINKYAKSGTTSTTAYVTNRANHLRFSERFDYPYWTKTNVTASSGISVISRALPYRNVLLDANQIQEIVYNGKYNYQGKRWYNLAPLTTRTSFTSNAIVDIFESTANDIHAVQAFGFSTNLSGDYFASSVYASPNNGVSKFRMQVGTVWADFDLSSISVITSTGTLYNNIRAVDTSTGWYLCQIIGPTVALGTLNFLETLPASDRIFLLQPLNVRPDSFIADDSNRYFFFNKGLADTTTMLSNFYIADGSTYTGNKQLLDSFVAGSLEGSRTSGNTAENVKFLTKFTAHRSGEFTSLTIKLINDVRGSAAKVAEDVFVNKTNKTWFQLAPYYNSSVHLNDYPTDYDRVRIGTQSGGPRGSNDPFETINLLLSRFWLNRDSSTATDVKTRQFINKQIDETKLIPTIPKFDAAAVAGLFFNTTRNIDGRRYTPQDGNYVYYKKTDWYSLAPRYARPRFAWGTGNTPGTIMIDALAFGDHLTYYQDYHLNDFLLIGSPDGVRGTSDNENFSYNLNMRPRRGAFTDLYIAKLRPTKFDADQTAGIFYGSSNSTTSYTKLNPYGKRWFQLAPYYASYEHIKDTPGQYDFVRVGSVRGGQRHLGWPTEILSLGVLKTPYETSVTADVRSNWFNLTAKISTTSDYTGYYLNRINLVTDSENLFNSSWTKSAVSLSTGSVIQSGALPFRNISLDADQVNEIFYNGNINNNYGKRWFQLVPSLRNRPNYTSTLVNVIVENSSNTQHYVETLINKSVTSDAWFAFSVYVRVQAGANRFRLAVNGQTADFRLSTESITASSAGVYARIRNIDTSTNTYLCNMLAASTSNAFAARIQLLNSAGNTSYAGDTSVGLYVWGAQFEVSEYYNELRNDVDNFRYLRSRGETSARLAVRFGADTRTDYILAGQYEDARLGGSSLENVSFLTKFVARRSGDATSLLITLGSITRTSADQTAEVFDNIKTSTPIMNTWYQLAPYYRSSLYNRPTDYDLVRVGSQTLSKRTSSDPYENVSFWLAPKPLTDSSTATDIKTAQYVRKEFSETRQIPQNSRFDAARVAGLELFSTSSQNINLSAYTPLSGGTQYYKSRDWYSEAPLSNRAKFAIGNAGTGPVMIDAFSFGDQLTYSGNKFLNSINVTVLENTNFYANKDAKQGVYTDLYIAKTRPSKYNADQALEIFYGTSNNTRAYTYNNPYKKSWYQLAPYYNSYEHQYNSAADSDRVVVGSRRGGRRESGWPQEILELRISKPATDTAVSTDVRTNWTNLTAKRAATDSSNVLVTTKTNYLTYSENFNTSFWANQQITINNTARLMSGKLPYRNTNYDALALGEFFYTTSTNTNAYAYWNNYYKNQWYSPAPRLNRSAFSSNVIQTLSASPGLDNHFLRADVKLPDYNTPEQYFSMSIYVSSAATRFRMDVGSPGQVYCDFNLSSGTVITSVGTIYNRITLIDTALGVYLCQVIGPIKVYNSTSILVTLQMLDATGTSVFVGAGNNLTLWGAQLELGDNFESMLKDWDNYRYIRTRGSSSNAFSAQIGRDPNTDAILLGDPNQSLRYSGTDIERVSFTLKKSSQRGIGTASQLLLGVSSITRLAGDVTADVFVNLKTSSPIINKWYQLAPYNRSYQRNYDTDFDQIRIGSQTGAFKTGPNPNETIAFWLAPKTSADSSTVTDINTAQYVRKEFSETRQIPQVARFDAARVMGLELVSSGAQRINLKSYTPLTGGIQYYKAWDWYSQSPLASRATFAIGNAGIGPVMLDNFLFGDVFTYEDRKLLSSIALTVGTQLTSVNLTYQTTALAVVSSNTINGALTTGNLVLYSNEITNSSAWAYRNLGALTPNYAPGNPDPALTVSADLVQFSGFSGLAPYYARQSLSKNISAGTVLRFTVWTKFIFANNDVFFGFTINGSAYGFYVSSGHLLTPTPTGSGVSGVQVQLATNSYYRYTFLLNAPDNLTGANTFIGVQGDTGATAGSQIMIWGVNVTEGPPGNPYTPDASTYNTYNVTTSSYIGFTSTYTVTSYTYPTTSSATNSGTKYSGDPAETIDVRLNKTAKQAAFTDLYVKNRRISPIDADQVLGILYNTSNSVSSIIRNNPYQRAWYQLAPYYNSYGHVKQSPQDTDRVLVSYKELFQPWLIKTTTDTASTTGDGGTRKQTGQNSLETTRLDVQLFARRSALTTSNVLITTKTNWVNYSEDFTGFYWGKTNAAAVQAPQLMSGLYPYRNTNYDAVQVANQFMLISTSSSFTRYNNYYNRAWYAPAPRTNRTAFSSTVLQYLTDQDAFGPHFMQAEVQLRDYSIPEEWVTYSLHVQKQTAGARRFRMDVGRCFADFDLSSVSVVTSTQTVRYANIRFVDTSAGVFLCQIIAPIQTFPNTLIRFAVTGDTVTAGDSGINFLFRDRRTFDDSTAAVESINNDKTTDYHL